MSAITKLRHLERSLPHLLDPLQGRVCEHHLARQSHDAELAHGVMRGPNLRNKTWYYPYSAAQPVAPFTGGVRQSGFRASAAWGASVAISLVRTELPLTAFYVARFLSVRMEPFIVDLYRQLQQGQPQKADADQENEDKTRAQAALATVKSALYAIAGLGLVAGSLEWLGGTGDRCAPGAHPVSQIPAWRALEAVRRHGILGWAQEGLWHLSTLPAVRRAPAGEIALLSAAITVGCLANASRLAAVAAMGLVAGLGAVSGLAYEGAHRALFLLGAFGHRQAQATPMGEVAERERAQRLLEFRIRGDDETLAAPFIDQLWQGRAVPQRNDNQVVHGLLMAMDLAEGLLHPDRVPFGLNVNARFQNRWWADEPELPQPQAQRRPQNVPHAPPRAPRAQAAGRDGVLPRAQDVNVHGVGRDQATRRAVANLLVAHPHVDVAAALAALRAHMQQAEAQRLPLSQAQHRNGRPALEAARRVLGPAQGFGDRGATITDDGNRLNVDNQGLGVVPMARICAVIWHAIDSIESPAGTEAATEALRQERRDALVLALSRCVEDMGHIVCAPGQSQRLVLVLQGYVPGVQVEIYDAPAPVAQFVTMQAMQLQQQLGAEGPWQEDVVRRAFNEACLAGYAIYQGDDRRNLQEQLAAIAELTYDVVGWQPPAG